MAVLIVINVVHILMLCTIHYEPKLRANESHLNDVELWKSYERTLLSNGIKGATELGSNNVLDMVWGFPIDYMHRTCLGVVKQVHNLWCTQGAKEQILREIQKLLINTQKLLLTTD